MIEPEEIVEMVASGRKVDEIAAECGMTDAAVRAMLDQEAKRLFDADKMLKDIMFESARLGAICKKFFTIAMADRGEVSNAAALIYVKTSERLSAMLGRNAPLGHAITIAYQAAPAQKQSSTEELRTLLDNFCHITHRERQLIDLEDEQGYDAERRAEINELRAARGKPPLEPSDDPSQMN